MVVRVNGGIINDQTLTGGLRFFKIVGPFAWTMSNGSVNLPVSVVGGDTAVTTYFTVGNNRPVPNSAAEIVLREISKQADIVLIGLVPGPTYDLTTGMDIALSASGLGWGSNVPAYDVPPANADEINLPTSPLGTNTPAATQMQAAIRTIPDATVYITVGAPNPITAPVPTNVSFAGVTVTEVSFSLGAAVNYYTLR